MTCCVIIPVYKKVPLDWELQSIRRTLSVFRPRREVYYLAPQSLDLRAYPKAGVLLAPDYYFANRAAYSELCVTARFYEALQGYDYMLIAQPDTWTFRDDLDTFMALDYDYIGAPWPSGCRLPDTVGNGGYCLRKTSVFAEICRDIIPGFHDPEDQFFVRNYSGVIRFAPVMTAARFALEYAAKRYMQATGVMPMGVHRPFDINSDFWIPILEEYGYKTQEGPEGDRALL